MEQLKSVEYLRKQLEELEMLQSIFPGPGELRVHERAVVADARDFVEASGETGIVLRRIGFTLHITCLEEEFTATCEYALHYPDEPPDIFVRMDRWDRDVQRHFNEDLEELIIEMEKGEVCILNAIQWVQENLVKYKVDQKKNVAQVVPVVKSKESNKFTRLWIHSHHIYSKFKRRDILDWSGDMKLTGFSLPGKPGIVCVEGRTSDAEEFWNRLRRLNWKKISCKHREDYPFPVDGWKPATLEEKRMGPCFSGFEELNLAARGFGTGRDYHMDFGLFKKFLEERGLTDIFKVLLGVEGKPSS